MSSKRPKFTVVIPTRERCDTLRAALRTCVTQDYDNLEILVSDNCSQDSTCEVVNSFHDPRVHYINTGRRLGMSQNWEFALSHVDEGYVTYLGDDDGLLPGALAEVSDLIIHHDCKAISWNSAGYGWPHCSNPDSRNLLSISLGTSLIKCNAATALQEVMSFRLSYEKLPWLYKGFVLHDVIQGIKRQSGRFFNSMIPDLYSGVALASVLESYHYSEKPYALNGASHHSIGTSTFSHVEKQAEKQFLSENNIPFHERLIMAPSIPILIAESALQAREHISSAASLKIDLSQVLDAALREATYYPSGQYQLVIEAVAEIARRNHLPDYSQKIAAHRNLPRSPARFHEFDILRRCAHLDCTRFGVRDVYEASLLCKHFLTLRDSGYFAVSATAKGISALLKRALRKILSVRPAESKKQADENLTRSSR
jgi:glycosyltransferase involved in cell wall biosynthesis